MRLALWLVLAAAGCDGVFGLQHIPERMRDAASDGVGDGRALCKSFAPPASYPVGTGPQGLTIADLTGDGILDIATANTDAASVTVLRNAGNGTFGSTTDLDAEAGVLQVVAARIDANDTLDVIASNYTAGSVSVYLGDGNGAFQPRTNILTGMSSAPVGLATGSFAGTSDGDIAVALSGSARVAVLLWDGSSHTVAPPIDVQLQPSQVVAANLDGDDTLDLAVTNAATGSVSIALGAGNGTFSSTNNLPIGSLPRALAAAPLAPGMPTSLFVASSGSGSIDMLRNDGNANFSKGMIGNVAGTPLGIAAADLDGDTFTDLAITSNATGTVTVLDGNGQGLFTPRTPLTTGTTPVAVGIADFDGDGHADLAVANQGSNTVSVFLGCH